MELVVTNTSKALEITQDASKYIASIEKQIKELQEKQKEFKQKLLQAMEENNVIKLETDDVVVTYVSSTERESFDSKTFKEENPEIYDAYVNIVPVSASIRIKVK